MFLPARKILLGGQIWFPSPERNFFTDFGSPPIPLRAFCIAKGDFRDILLLEIRRRIPFDFQRTSLAGLALDSATSSGLGRAPALQCRTPSRHHLELQDRRDYTPADRAARTFWEKEKITRAPRERETRTHLKKVSPLRGSFSLKEIVQPFWSHHLTNRLTVVCSCVSISRISEP
ncbi:hypothetical protein TNCV_1407661 [Trichonephila clavipes]|nr:hypothetical protein TNCV_1407661 [Trichonephila clavipes]